MKKQTKKALAATYLEITGTKSPSKWTADKLATEVAKLDIAMETSMDAEIDEKPEIHMADVVAQVSADFKPREIVVTTCCNTERTKGNGETWHLTSGQWLCEAGHGCKAQQTTENPLATLAKATSKAKAKKATKAPKTPPYGIFYAVRGDIPTAAWPKTRQINVILSTINRLCAETGTPAISRQMLQTELDANNNNSTEIAATTTHDLQARQPVLNILGHYNKGLVASGLLLVAKSQAEYDAIKATNA